MEQDLESFGLRLKFGYGKFKEKVRWLGELIRATVG